MEWKGTPDQPQAGREQPIVKQWLLPCSRRISGWHECEPNAKHRSLRGTAGAATYAGACAGACADAGAGAGAGAGATATDDDCWPPAEVSRICLGVSSSGMRVWPYSR
eukprot:3715320-Prymnesium_polylepis.2